MAGSMDNGSAETPRHPAYGFMAALAVAALLFCGLGIWQIYRLGWKEALIARIDSRVHAAPVPLPDARLLASADRDHLEYLRITVTGRYRSGGTTLVHGTTTLGKGYWVLAPLEQAHGQLVYINRGFVPSGSQLAHVRARTPRGAETVTGLMRISEPGGTLLQSNDPAADRWYSRDIPAIAASHHIHPVPPIFVDAQAARPADSSGPVPGLTVVSLPNNHLSYVLTWFALAALSVGQIVYLWRRRL